MAGVLLIQQQTVLLLTQMVKLALLGVIGVELVPWVPVLVEGRELLLKLPVVLTRGLATADHRLLRRLAVHAELLLVHRSRLVPVAGSLIVEVVVVRAGLRVAFGAVAQFLLGRSVLVNVLLL